MVNSTSAPIRGIITKDIMDRVFQIMIDGSLDTWNTFLEQLEPIFHEQALSSSRMIAEMYASENKIANANSVVHLGNILFSCILMGYLSKYIAENALVHRLFREKTTDELIDDWLNGKMPSRFYCYDTNGMDPKSPKYQAKMAYLARLKKIAEKKKMVRQAESILRDLGEGSHELQQKHVRRNRRTNDRKKDCR